VPLFQHRIEGGDAVSVTDDAGLVVGVDTHLDSHTAAVCDARGRAGPRRQVPASAAGYAQLLGWVRATAAGRQVTWAIEGTRHYGLGLARYLASQGGQVAGIDAARHVGKRRAGKSDPIDAVRAARELLARPHPGQMRADGDREVLRLLMLDRDNAVESSAPRWPRSWSPPPRRCAASSGISLPSAAPGPARTWPARRRLTGWPGRCT
jgi:transposase